MKENTSNSILNRPALDRRLLALLVVAGLAILRNIHSVTPWKGTHYVFRYSEGLVSRALLGSILEQFWGARPISLEQLTMLTLPVLFLLAAALAVLVYRSVRASESEAALLLGLLFLTSPGTLAFFSVDLGRLDQWGLLLLMLSLPFFFRLSDRGQKVLLGVVLLLLVLIHEVFLVSLGCLYVALYMTHRRALFATWKGFFFEAGTLLLCLLPATLLCAYMLGPARLSYSPEALASLREILSSHATFEASKEATIIHFRSIKSNLAFTQNTMSQQMRMLGTVLAFMVLLPSLAAGFLASFRQMRSFLLHAPSDSWSSKLVIVASFLLLLAPLSLMWVGIDYPRWLAVVLMNLYVYWFLFAEPVPRLKTDKGLRIGRRLVVLLCILQFLLGGITATNAPYLVQWFAKALYGAFF